jgi:hypothetical protein
VNNTTTVSPVASSIEGNTTTTALVDVNNMTTTVSPNRPKTFEEAKQQVAIAMAAEDREQSDINIAQLKLRQAIQSKAPKAEIIAQRDAIKKKLYDLGRTFNNFRARQNDYLVTILKNKS